MEDIANAVKQVLGSEQRAQEAEEELRAQRERYNVVEQEYDCIERHNESLERQNRRLRHKLTKVVEWANQAHSLAHVIKREQLSPNGTHPPR